MKVFHLVVPGEDEARDILDNVLNNIYDRTERSTTDTVLEDLRNQIEKEFNIDR